MPMRLQSGRLNSDRQAVTGKHYLLRSSKYTKFQSTPTAGPYGRRRTTRLDLITWWDLPPTPWRLHPGPVHLLAIAIYMIYFAGEPEPREPICADLRRFRHIEPRVQ